MLISFEGINGCGKSTLINKLSKHISDQGYKVKIITSKPDPDVLKKHDLFFNPFKDKTVEDQIEYTKLFMDAQAEMYQSFEKDTFYLADRWRMSSYVYTSVSARSLEELMYYQNFFLTYNKKKSDSDMIIYMRISPEESFTSIDGKDRSKPVSGYENLKSLNNIHDLYEKTYMDIHTGKENHKDLSHMIGLVSNQNNSRLRLFERQELTDKVLSDLFKQILVIKNL